MTGIKAGHRIQAKFSHLPGMTNYRWCRILARTVKQDETTAELYNVDLELDPAPWTPTIVQIKTGTANGTLTLDAPPAAGNTLVMWETTRYTDTPTTAAGWTACGGMVSADATPSYNGQFFYKVAAIGESATQHPNTSSSTGGMATIVEVEGVLTLDTSAGLNHQLGPAFAVSLTPTAGANVMIFGGYVQHVPDFGGPYSAAPGLGVTELADTLRPSDYSPLHWMGYRLVPAAAGAYTVGATAAAGPYSTSWWGGQVVAFTGVP